MRSKLTEKLRNQLEKKKKRLDAAQETLKQQIAAAEGGDAIGNIGGSMKKPRRWHPGTVRRRAIRAWQKNTSNPIPKAVMRRVFVSSLTDKGATGTRVAASALSMLSDATLAYLHASTVRARAIAEFHGGVALTGAEFDAVDRIQKIDFC